MKIKDICILFGGKSTEHEISCKSAMLAIDSLSRDLYNISLIGISHDGQWYLYNGEHKNIQDGSWIKARDKYKVMIDMSSQNEKLCYIKDDEIYNLISPIFVTMNLY